VGDAAEERGFFSVDTLKGIDRLAHQARKERIPGFDVADQVLQRIRSEETEAYTFMPFDLFAGVSAVAAAVVSFFSIGAWKFITSPLMDLFAPLQEVRLW
jgi:hypothetical protein